MEILESYKNLFVSPRDFSSDKLVDGWPWWAYYIMIFVINLPIVIMNVFLGAAFGGMGTIYMAVYSIIAPFVFVLFINAPFKKKGTTWPEIYQVNFAYHAYVMPLMLVYTLMQFGMLYFLFKSFAGVMILALIMLVGGVWLLVSYFKILSELHNASAWKIFGWTLLIGLIVGAIMYGITMSMLGQAF